MAGTNVPAVTFGPTGFIAPAAPAVLAGVQADISAAFGKTLNFALNTPQGQIASSQAAVIFNTNSIFVYYTNQVDPALATGRMQDAIARIYFITRLPSLPTVLQVACLGAQGVVIPVNALIADPSGNLYACTGAGTIPIGGALTLSFAAQIVGPTAVPQSVSIYQAIPGWDSVSIVSGVVGQNVESRAQFEARRKQSVAKNAVGSLPAVLGAVLAVPGVLDAYVTDNSTNAPLTIGGFTLAANSLYVAVSGGAAAAIAQAIWTKKAPGCAYNGNTAVTVFDQNSGYSPPFPSYQVSFQIPAALPVLFAITFANSTLVPADATTQIANAIIAAFNGNDGGARARIGSTIYASRFSTPIAALGSWASIISLAVGSNNTSSAVVVGSIAGNTLTVTRVVSGTLAVGQTISGSDALNLISSGMRITALGTGTGGTGTYTVGNPQTLAGASFTGTGSGVNLTASAVTGAIAVGDVLAGTGVPTGTTILSQTSGTPGGAGVYVTSGATTASGAAITAGAVITAAVANQNLVAVGIAQEPTIDPSNIFVVLQ